MKTIKSKLALLDETVQYYSEDIARRCNDNGCYYDGSKNTRTQSDGCAVGRLLSKRMASAFDEQLKDKLSNVGKIFYQLPSKIQSYGLSFLNMLQDLHDVNDYWNVSGLSEKGKTRVDEIRRMIKSKQI